MSAWLLRRSNGARREVRITSLHPYPGFPKADPIRCSLRPRHIQFPRSTPTFLVVLLPPLPSIDPPCNRVHLASIDDLSALAPGTCNVPRE